MKKVLIFAGNFCLLVAFVFTNSCSDKDKESKEKALGTCYSACSAGGGDVGKCNNECYSKTYGGGH